MIAHGINVAEGFQVTEVGRSFGSGWSQITEKILTDKNFEFFRTTVTIQTRSRSGAIVRIGEQIGMAI